MERCHQIYVESSDVDARRSAVELLRVVADRRALQWVGAYLSDPDAEIQQWGAGIVDQLLFADLVEVEECEILLRAMATHPNASVREKHADILQFLEERS